MQPVHRVLVLTDLVDSTRLVERIGDARAVEVWLAHDRAARALLARHDGREIDRTDGFLLIFERVDAAVAFAAAYHDALARLAAELDLPILARVGIHAGPVVLIENPPEAVARGTKPYEIEGLAKPLAARIMSVARGGQTLLSAAARAALSEPESAFTSHGFWRFKGIIEPSELFEPVRDGAPTLGPPADSEKVWRVARNDDLWVPTREIRHHLPAERDRFLGREAELAALAGQLHGGARLVTITGMGGTGKTRFVTRFAHLWLGEWTGGVWFCDLIEARDLAGICAAVARALDVPLTEQSPVRQLGHALAARGPSLIILDNFEQLVPHAADTLGRWLEDAPAAQFIVTSRETLGIRGEALLPLAPLPVHGGETSPAASLFIERARAARPDFRLTETNAAHIARLVSLLDGIPLAIELAAARATVLSPAQLVERMSDRFRLLVGKGQRGDRANTLRACIDASWEMLGRAEQLGLAQLSVFVGSFSLEAALAVLDLDALPDAPWPEDVLQSLVGRSLLRTVPMSEGESQFSMLSLIQGYAAEKLGSPDGVAGLTGPAARIAAERRHGALFAQLGAREPLHGALDDLLAATRRAVANHEPEIAADTALASAAVLELRGPLQRSVEGIGEVLRLPGLSAEAQGRLTNALGQALRASGRTAEAEAAYDQARALGERGAPELLAESLEGLGVVRRRQGRLAEAAELVGRALELRRRRGDRAGEGRALTVLANLSLDRGDRHEAIELIQRALTLHRGMGDRRAEAIALGQLGRALHGLGQTQQARETLEQALSMHRLMHNRHLESVILTDLGSLSRTMGRPAEAESRYAAALVICREMGNRALEGALLGNIGLCHHEQGRLDAARAQYEAALPVLAEVGNRASVASLLGNLGNLHVEAVRGAAARQCYEQALDLHRALGTRSSEGFVWLNLGALLRLQGRFPEAAAALDAARQLHEGTGDRRMLGATAGEVAHLALDRGQLDAVDAPLADALQAVRSTEDRRALATILLIRARAELQRGQDPRPTLDEALAAATAVGDHPTELALRCEAALAALARGDRNEAQAIAQAAEAVPGAATRSIGQAALLHLRGRLALAAAQPDRAREALSALRALGEELDATPDSALRREAEELAAALR